MDKKTLPKVMYWTKGDCTVEILRAGNFPDTVMVELPNHVITQIAVDELEIPAG